MSSHIARPFTFATDHFNCITVTIVLTFQAICPNVLSLVNALTIAVP